MLILLLLLGILILLAVLALAHIFSVMARLHHHSQQGREASAALSPKETPLVTFNHAGNPGDPINLQLVGTQGQIGAAFAAAGWFRADEITFLTSLRISVDSLLGRAYSTAPVSNLYLYGRKEDLAFEQPGHNARQRDHLRLWQTPQRGEDGRPTWIGSATKDVKVELSMTNHLPTHGIAPDIDNERALVVSELAASGYLIGETSRPGFGQETHGVNGGGDPYVTDGQVAVLTLANVWTPLLAAHVHSPLLAHLASRLARFTHHRLPQAGRERAARERARRAQGGHKSDAPPL